ncbi:hypothetical protein [uncultured Draconibacterium sp.]|uniref:hypothetical protein n=1 Tax=uncultured Draconibacterium sp. TaxID=1573823 RepID=UPI0025CBEE3B|nr:hypothetical protein [uncultured Draconibacterium sp.]
MSVSELKKLEILAFKPSLTKFKLGDLVTEIRTENPEIMVVSDLCPIGDFHDNDADYCCSWITNRGKIKEKPFKQKDLKILEK